MSEKIGKYIIVEEIAKGGMGIVYKVKHPTLETFMILKKLSFKGDSTIVERFKREAKIMFDFRSENIVQVYDHFKEGGSYYIVMEYIDGIGLDKVIQTKRYLSNEAALLIFAEICKGLKYAHDKGVIHRDIKPANILISKEGEVKITDFGIAKSDEEESGLTQKGTTLGTPSYMAPEQIADSKNVDKRADIFSLGVLLYQMVTGKLPFSSDMAVKTIALIQKGKYKNPKKVNPHVMPRIQAIIKKMMQNKAKKRYRDLGIVIDKLRSYMKKYKTQQRINEAIKEYVFGEEKSKLLKHLSKGNFFSLGNFIFRIIPMVLITGSLFYLLYYKGYYYDLFLRDQYGKVKIIVKTPVKNLKEDREYFIAYLSYKNKENTYTEIKKIKCFPAENTNKKRYNYVDYSSEDIFLPSGQYRINLSAENEKYYSELFVEPIVQQIPSKIPSRAKEIEFINTETPEVDLEAKFKFYEINGSKELENVSIYVQKNQQGWVKWEDIKKYRNTLKSGNRYAFKFEKEGYIPKKISISVNHYETVLKINVYLIQKPGTVFIKSNHEGLEVLLNNQKYYLSGDENRKYTPISPTKTRPQKLILAPGSYIITFRKGKTSQSENIDIKSEETKNIYAGYDINNEQITISIK